MTRLSSLALLAALCLAQFSCSDDDGPGQFRYPLKVGRTWYYTHSQLIGPSADSLELTFQERIQVSVGAVEQLGEVGASYRLDFYYPEDPELADAMYYQNKDDGLWHVASCLNLNARPLNPKRVTNLALHEEFHGVINHLDLASVLACDGPPTIEPEPSRSIAYPIRVGQKWLYRIVPELSLTIEKRVAGWTNVEVPAGTFNAYRYEWIYTSDFELSIVDDVASAGLVRRQIVSQIRLGGALNPSDTTTQIFHQLLELDSLKL